MTGAIDINRVHHGESGIKPQTTVDIITVCGIFRVSLPGEVHILAGGPWSGREYLKIGNDFGDDDSGVGVGVKRVFSP